MPHEARGLRNPVDIALTHPYCWPYVRRGTERNMDGLGRWLTGRGHHVVTLSSRPGSSTREHTAAGERWLYPQYWSPLLGRMRIQPTHTFLVSALRGLRRLHPSVVHSFYFTDAFAAQLLAARKGFRTVLQVNGTPVPGAFHRLFPPDRQLVRRVLRGTDTLLACSAYVSDMIHACYGVRSEVIVPPVDVSRFRPGAGALQDAPVLLSVADFDQPNKNLSALLQAFTRLRSCMPQARLRLSGRLSPATWERCRAGLPQEVENHIERLGLGAPEDLPRLYGEASLLVLPSMWEASGSVMFEAWACGTPVLATAHGGPPEFVTADVGVLFDPEADGQEVRNIAGLHDGMRKGLELASDPGVRERCRSHALSYSWDALGPEYEHVYGL